METEKQNFNGGYIEASQKAYDLLVELGYIAKSIPPVNASWLFVRKDNIYNYTNNQNSIETLKQFYINNGALSWDKPLPEYRPPIADASVPTQISSMDDLNNLPTADEEENLGDMHQNNPVFKDIKANAIRERIKKFFDPKVFLVGIAMGLIGFFIGAQQ